MIISSSNSGDSSWGTVNEVSFFAAVFRHILTDSELLESYYFQELLNLISQRTLEVTTKHSNPQISQRTDLLCRILKFRKRSLLSCTVPKSTLRRIPVHLVPPLNTSATIYTGRIRYYFMMITFSLPMEGITEFVCLTWKENL